MMAAGRGGWYQHATHVPVCLNLPQHAKLTISHMQLTVIVYYEHLGGVWINSGVETREKRLQHQQNMEKFKALRYVIISNRNSYATDYSLYRR